MKVVWALIKKEYREEVAAFLGNPLTHFELASPSELWVELDQPSFRQCLYVPFPHCNEPFNKHLDQKWIKRIVIKM